MLFRVSLLLCLLLALPATAAAIGAEVDLTWEAPARSEDGSAARDIAGYRIYFGIAKGDYSFSVDVGNRTFYRVNRLGFARTYFFNITAYDESGNESRFGSERSVFTRSRYSRAVDFNSDGVPDPDRDGDGLSDLAEDYYGTSKDRGDTDKDGVLDGAEIELGTNPLDPGSMVDEIPTGGCALWNSAFGGIWNVLEQSNLGSSELTVSSVMTDVNGAALRSSEVELPAASQLDHLVHEWNAPGTYGQGQVCSAHDGAPGTLAGRIIHYLPEINPLKPRLFQFAYASSMSSGRYGAQSVPYNTFNPSLLPWEAGNIAANWLHLSNAETRAQVGTLRFFDEHGGLLVEHPIELPAMGQLHLPLHGLGAGRLGTAQWIPANGLLRSSLHLSRYLHDNPTGFPSFDAATQFQGAHGSGEELYVPVDTIGRNAVIEVMNTGDRPINVSMQIVGGSEESRDVALNPHSVSHVLIDPVIGVNSAGFVVLRSDTPGSLAAYAVHYGRRPDGGMQYLYSIPAKETTGKTLRGSYNTFLGQSSWLVAMSPVRQQVLMHIRRPDGTILAKEHFDIDGLQLIDLGRYTGPDQNGIVELFPRDSNSVVAWINRVKPFEYVVPTEMR
ncbi:MAG: fibronectin type III domain-containing protein [Bdellovibrionales bacterium]|nr:fibronectin type III domain-containing protein [Bdellovibrionales bacterium]